MPRARLCTRVCGRTGRSFCFLLRPLLQALFTVFSSYFAMAASEPGYSLSYRTVRLPFGDLRMTALLECCARGLVQELARELEAARHAGGLSVELAVVDDWAGSSPLHWAAYAGSAEAIDMLIAVGAQPSTTNTVDGSQPLHLAARYGRPAAARALLYHGADVNAINNYGNTPLHEVCYKVQIPVALTAEVLLSAAARLDIYNNSACRLLPSASTGSRA